MTHFKQAREATETALQQNGALLDRAVLIDDVFGKIRVVAWFAADVLPNAEAHLRAALTTAAGPFWSGDLWVANGAPAADLQVYETVWEEADEITPGLRRSSRRRTRGFWLEAPSEPAWLLPDDGGAAPIIAFYSFKGGVGRTTALSSFAILRARKGERVAVLDLDLDAPGVGLLLDPGEISQSSPWGVVDYLLEVPLLEQVELKDYYHVCAREVLTGAGEILVFPSGRLDQEYLATLARLDLEPPHSGKKHPLLRLLEQVRDELRPDWILLDCRAGLSEASGFALSGLAHLTVLLGTTSNQSWDGLRLLLDRLGADRVRKSKAQSECLIVQAMVPEDPATGRLAREHFAERAAEEFERFYYAEDPTDPDEDAYWYMRDMDTDDAPHVPIAISYTPRLAFLRSIEDAVPVFLESEYAFLETRISSRFAKEGE
jgi:cellulose biosynthesis protein BcsQ